ncbi:MAG: hypothetical protein RR891_02360 [Clostridium sp.]|uniref:hypothetical protein n=1 Tax=Clostridium sp. TaxID=1506 RepID=UPI0030556567
MNNKKKIGFLIGLIGIIIVATGVFVVNGGGNKGGMNKPLTEAVAGQAELKENIIVISGKHAIKTHKEIEGAIQGDSGNVVIYFKKEIASSMKELKNGDIFYLEPSYNIEDSLYSGFIGKVNSVDASASTVEVAMPELEEVFNAIDIDTSKMDKDVRLDYVQVGDNIERMKGRIGGFDPSKGEFDLGNNVKLKYSFESSEKYKSYINELALSFDNYDMKVGKLSGNVTLSDLFIDMKLSLNDGSVKERSMNVVSDVTANTKFDFTDIKLGNDTRIPIAYIAYQLGGVKIGVGDVKPILLGAGITVYIDVNGTITLDMGIDFNHESFIDINTGDDKVDIKGKNYPHPFLKDEKDNEEDINPSNVLNVEGTGKGIANLGLPIKTRGYLGNIDLIGFEVGPHLDGNMDLSAKAAFDFNGDKQSLNPLDNVDIDVSAKLDFLIRFKLYSDLIDQDILNKEFMRKNLIDFAWPERVKKEDIYSMVDGYWIASGEFDDYIHRLNTKENTAMGFNFGIGDAYGSVISNYEYEEANNILKVFSKDDKGDTVNYEYEIEDENNVKFKQGNGVYDSGDPVRLKRVSYKEAVYLYYGSVVFFAEDNYMNISTSDYRSMLYNTYVPEILVDKSKQKENYTKQEAMMLAGAIGRPDELVAREIDVIPGIRSWDVGNMNGGTGALSFEGSETPNSLKEKYKKVRGIR